MNNLLTEKDFIKIGHTGGLHGYDGSVHLILDEAFKTVLDRDQRFIYYLENGMFVPRFIRAWNSDKSKISFERITVREEARGLTDQDVYLRKHDLPDSMPNAHETDFQPWNLLDGYQLWDVSTDTLTGAIESVEEYPGGWMMEVNKENRSESLLVPLAEPLIDRIDEENRVLYMRLPMGLEEL